MSTPTAAGVPFLDLRAQSAEIRDEVLAGWTAVLDSAGFIGGPQVEAFEREYAEYIGVEHCIGVGNGTDAIELALRALGVGSGDEVIIPANTFVATAEAVWRTGARPVLVDVDAAHLLIDPAKVEAAITEKTAAIIPVHLYGQVAPVEAIEVIPAVVSRAIPIVEDAAQSQGAHSLRGRAGAMGRIAATSFYPGKNLGAAGDAGAVLTNDSELASIVRNLAAHGSSKKYVHDRPGFNSRLDAMQAVVLRAKLKRLEDWNIARRAIAANYGRLLAPLADSRVLTLPSSRAGSTDVWHLYVVQADDRDRVLADLNAAGIGAAIHYPTPVHLTGAFAHLGYGAGSFPVVEAAADSILSLPMFPHLSEVSLGRVVDALAVVLERATEAGVA
ncbi:DegT/DnrJ/EryC1/StrS family aminotransferase [Gryllotalpicola protaetiae]|uniref:DegT/DnrJ/EryC1/StrS family aminotransferase n=1 Tax=Gryllotalpicola protaetiae TaxID=2419771 RepID=A0A387BQ87_9MICO|nr:DegT/DnrJ/EryC1/StrS family aminotransferase [Gryllotalpicola protaetiae]AYG03190.1 DegT/DnrJ/EryC1/StrS family aminotransferase [Gryllotalpicola protaetiae]